MFEFEWDPAKAASNLRKHNVSFELARTAFLDPLMLTNPDEDHSEFEQRWVTMGQAEDGRLPVVAHTESPIEGGKTWVRIISARPATPAEQRDYEVGG